MSAFYWIWYFLEDAITFLLLVLCGFLAFMWYKEKKKNAGVAASHVSIPSSTLAKAQPTGTSSITTTTSGIQSYLSSIPDKLTKWSSPQKDVVVDGKVVGPVTRSYTTPGVASEFFQEEVVPRVIGSPHYTSVPQYAIPGTNVRSQLASSLNSPNTRVTYRTVHPSTSADSHAYRRVGHEPASRVLY
eukprot:GGOE01019869.1.p1 GENE.GGOE01019869.1~~GGOE01019869.1.p1  ORF type:complete len:187 (-),score=12.71 GGOE01019869.1:276-836(-)